MQRNLTTDSIIWWEDYFNWVEWH